MKRHRFSNLPSFGGLWAVTMVVGCTRTAMVGGIPKDAGKDGPASFPDTRESGQPIATGGQTGGTPGSSTGGSTTSQGGQGGGDVAASTDGAGGNGAGGITGAGGTAGRDAGRDGSDGNLAARETGRDRFDQKLAIDAGEPLACNGMLTFGGFLPLTDRGGSASVGGTPGLAAVGDVNGDRKLDLVTADTDGTVSVLLGNGDGTLGGLAKYVRGSSDPDAMNYPAAVALGDVNGDGKLDIVTANPGVGTVSVLLGRGGGTFSTPLDYPAGSTPTSDDFYGPWSVALGDFDGDGHLDIATANSGPSTVSVLLGKGDGTFAAMVDYATGASPSSVVLGDLNRDGNLDLVAVNSTTLSIMLGKGDGTLAAAVELSIGTDPHSAALADVNGDGKLDLVVGTDRQVAVLLGKGDGKFAVPVTYPTAWSVWGLILGDFDGNAKLDILAWVEGSGTFALLLGQGDGTFAPRVDFPAPESLVSLAVGDMNGDGKLDIALVSDPLPTGTAGVLLGRGDGTFGETAYAVGHDTAAIEVGDLDGDGKLDVATVGKTSDGIGKLSVLLGKGDGTLAAPTDYGLPGTPSLVRLADVNGDGRLDVVSASSDVTTVTVLLGKGGGTFTNVASDAGSQPRAMALADVDGDGKLDLVISHADKENGAGSATVLLGQGDGTFSPNNTFPVCYVPDSVVLADLDGDGQLDMVVACEGWNSMGQVHEGEISVLLGKGNGTFVPRGDYFGGLYYYGMNSVAIGDLDDDGKLDLAAVDSDVVDGIRVLLGNGDGTLAEPVEYTTPWFARRIALVDINRDGKLDAVTQDDFGGQGCSITVLLGNGDGTLAPMISYPVDAQGLAFGDMNGDGRLDLVAATHSNAVNVLLGACR